SRAEGCGWKNLALAGAEQHDLGVECEDARRIESGEIIHMPKLGHALHRGCADEHGAAIDLLIDPQLAASVGTNEIGRGTRVLGEAHVRKILNWIGAFVSTHYFRFALRGGPDRQASPLLERLLARADGFTEVGDWRAEAFRVIAPRMTHLPGLGACALYAERGTVQGGSVLFATPVHYVAEMSNVRLPADGMVTLQ